MALLLVTDLNEGSESEPSCHKEAFGCSRRWAPIYPFL